MDIELVFVDRSVSRSRQETGQAGENGPEAEVKQQWSKFKNKEIGQDNSLQTKVLHSLGELTIWWKMEWAGAEACGVDELIWNRCPDGMVGKSRDASSSRHTQTQEETDVRQKHEDKMEGKQSSDTSSRSQSDLPMLHLFRLKGPVCKI